MSGKSKKIAIIEKGYGLAPIIKKLIKEGYTVDFYSHKDSSINIPGINRQILLNKSFKYKNLNSIKRYSEYIRQLTKDQNYDFIFSPRFPLEFGCNVFHFNSMVHRQKILRTSIERFFFYLGHKSLIDYYKNWHKTEHQKIFVVSNNLKDDYSQNCNIPVEKIVVLPPGYSYSSEIESYKKPFLLGKNKFIFGMSAIGFNRKGGYLALLTLSSFFKKYPDSKCKIIYPGFKKNLMVRLLAFLLNLNRRVEFLDYQKNMSDFYNSINCLLVPSRHEAFGLVTTQAMMHKTLVIVSSTTGSADVIKDGENGFIFDITKNAKRNLFKKMEYVMLNYNDLDNCIENAFNTAKFLNWENFANIIVQNLSN